MNNDSNLNLNNFSFEEQHKEFIENSPKSKYLDKTFILMVVLFVFSALLVVYLGYYFYTLNFIKPKDPFEIATPNIVQENKIVEELNFYFSKQHKFELKYPKNAAFTERDSSDPITYKISYVKDNSNSATVLEENIDNGYMFKVIVYPQISNTDLEALANNKRAGYNFNKCRADVRVGRVNNTMVNNLPAKYFEVQNCPADYIETFVMHEGIVYELVQIYKGEVGLKQSYKSATNEILANFNLIETPKNSGDFLTEAFTDRDFSFSFEHPKLQSCCAVLSNLPISTERKTTPLGKNDMGFAFYVSVLQKQTFDQFLQDQKTMLLDNYKLVKEVAPQNFTEEKITFGKANYKAVLLKNYAWWGDIIYVEFPNKLGVLTISTTNNFDPDFSLVFSQVLDSLVIN